MNGFTPNNNTNVIRLLSEAIRKCNKSRNRILMGAVVLCILTLTFVFGTAYGKINAEYTKNIRMDGTTASTYIEEGTKQQYEKALENIPAVIIRNAQIYHPRHDYRHEQVEHDLKQLEQRREHSFLLIALEIAREAFHPFHSIHYYYLS